MITPDILATEPKIAPIAEVICPITVVAISAVIGAVIGKKVKKIKSMKGINPIKASQVGFEPTTSGFLGRYSSQLSYWLI